MNFEPIKDRWKTIFGFSCGVIFITTAIVLFLMPGDDNYDAEVSVLVVGETVIEPTDKRQKKIVSSNEAATKTVINSDNRPELISKRTPETKLPGSFSQHLDRLLAQYDGGDLSAGFILAINLAECFSVSSTIEAFSEKISKEYVDDDEVGLVPQREEAFYYCLGVSKQMRNQYFDILTAVANSGYPPAQTMYGLFAPPEFLTDDFSLLSVQQRQQQFDKQTRQTVSFLENASQGGSLHAMLKLVLRHRDDSDQDKNSIKALAYNLALLDLTTHNVIYDQFMVFKEEIEREMSAAQIDAAMQQSRELINKVIINGVLYQL